MELTIYADVLFATNYLMDLVILFLTVQLSRNELKISRLSLATTLLAFYGTVSFVPELGWILSGVGKFLVGIMAIWILGPRGGWRGFLKMRVVFSLVSIALGGMVYALAIGTRLGQSFCAVSVNGAVYFLLDLRLLLAGILLAYGVLFLFRRVCIRNFSRDRILVPMEMVINGEKIVLTALADTGCELTAPITGEGVLLISERILRGITPKNSFWLSVHTATGEDRIPAFYPDNISCLSGKFNLVEEPLIGIIPGRLSMDDLYSGIFNPKILEDKYDVGGKYHEKEVTTVATMLLQNLTGAVSNSAQGSLLHWGKRNTSGTSGTRRRGGAAVQTGYSSRAGSGEKGSHRAKSSAGRLHS